MALVDSRRVGGGGGAAQQHDHRFESIHVDAVQFLSQGHSDASGARLPRTASVERVTRVPRRFHSLLAWLLPNPNDTQRNVRWGRGLLCTAMLLAAVVVLAAPRAEAQCRTQAAGAIIVAPNHGQNCTPGGPPPGPDALV